jgi:hypothetical protein
MNTQSNDSFNRSLLLVAAVIAMCMMCAVRTSAQATEPASPARPGAGMMRGAGGNGPQRPWVSPEERERIEEFAEQNMPNPYRMWQEAPEPAPRRWRLMSHAAREYRRYQQEQNAAPQQADAMLKRIRTQDELFAIVREYRQAATPQQDEIRARLREKMRDIVVQMLEEREERIARLRQMLQREESALENDRGRVEEITARRVDTLLEETRPGGRPGGAGPRGDASDEPRDARPAPEPSSPDRPK